MDDLLILAEMGFFVAVIYLIVQADIRSDERLFEKMTPEEFDEYRYERQQWDAW